MSSSTSFTSYLSTPLPVDQKLLTLLNFNLVRALISNVILLGTDPEQLARDDLESPFVDGQEVAEERLPPILWPTVLQRTLRHHPEVDILPFPAYRDNMLLAGDSINNFELCADIIYGVNLEEEGEGVVGRHRTCREVLAGDA